MVFQSGLNYTAIGFYERAKHIRDADKFHFSPLIIFKQFCKTFWSLKNELMGVKSSASEPIGSDEDRQEV
jgi:hypothetical protein